MPIQTIMAIFGDLGAAERARAELMEAGIARHRIALSADLAPDGIAAEAPGQSYENQGYFMPEEDEREAARLYDEVASGACVVSVASDPRDRERIAELLRSKGARRTLLRPG